ncbi:hypothetical protein [Chitinophaga filiformis]|uniref:Uncharacterized protein n=1 Tax=Chitinophaga filiformis TaxID=104663 RepID=A0ABY4HW27_CHIFI|nr:hypothetical protein [Chitinophaga filiformis]UPK67985.1 hypothetical protein MYF79_23820 [Chitinophaga filiformis]
MIRNRCIDHHAAATEARYCLLCGAALKGRADKKFCDDYYRNEYNNTSQKDTIPLIKRINRILKRNRDILREALGNGVNIELHLQVLIEMDFNFSYHTHFRQDGYGNTTFFCYEYAFRLLRDSCVMIYKIKNLPLEGGALINTNIHH